MHLEIFGSGTLLEKNSSSDMPSGSIESRLSKSSACQFDLQLFAELRARMKISSILGLF
jgi:hypothetical protein